MSTAPGKPPGIWSAAIIGACLIAFGCGCQAAFAPTVRVSCPARTATAPDCDLRWLVAFDQLTIRHTPLPALQPVGEIVQTAPTRKGGATTLYLNTSAGPVRTIMWGDHVSLQDLRDPLHRYFADAHAPAIDLTMWPSRWAVEDGGIVVRKPHPIRLVANAIIVIGLLFWVSVIVEILRRPLVSGAIVAVSLWPAVAAGQAQPAAPLPAALAAHLKGESLQIVTSIRGLPLGVRDELQTLFGSQTLDIADPGAEFQATDVIFKPNLPRRRLVAAGCSQDHCLVYYERGGIAHTWHVALFRWTPQLTRFEWGGMAPGDLTTIDRTRGAVLSGQIKNGSGSW